MIRKAASSMGLGVLALLWATDVSAQTRVDIGVWTPGAGGRVVIGRGPSPRPIYRAPVYHAPVYRRPVYRAPRHVYVAPPYYRHDNGRHLGWSKKGRARAEAEYRRNLQRAEREYYEDLRDADREYRRDSRRW